MAIGIDSLNKAVRAAGFAMVPLDDYAVETPPARKAAALPAPQKSAWRAALPVPTHAAALPRVVVRGSLVRHWLAGWGGKTAAS